MQDQLTWNEVATKITDTLLSVVGFIDNIIYAAIIVLIGVLVGWAFKTIIIRTLQAVKLKPYFERLGLSKVYPGKFDLIEFLGDLIKWTVIIVFLIPALEVLIPKDKADYTVGLVNSIVEFIPSVIIAIAILIVGIIIADLVARAVEGTAATVGAKSSRFLADFARWSIVVFVLLLALAQLNISQIDTIIQAISFGVGAAFALSFGLGGQDFAKDVIARFRKNLPK